jgi:NAD(P)-dependent dehydrogenase (short-subunit alcohol dehydrogenase family)
MHSALFDVSGRTIVITGGLGQLGKQYALALLQHEAQVSILDPLVGQTELGADLQSYHDDGQLLLVPADVTNKHSLEDALVTIKEKTNSPVFGLINNAALDSPPDAKPEETGPFEVFPEESWDRVMDVNVKGVFLACQVFGRDMAQARQGSIINIGSTYGTVSPDHRIYEYRQEDGGPPFFKPVAYSASKSALINLTKYISVYWAKSGVRANLMTLGGVFNHQDKRFVDGYCARVPLGRMAEESEYNGTVIYLMSNASSYVTGTTITLDGGWTAW